MSDEIYHEPTDMLEISRDVELDIQEKLDSDWRHDRAEDQARRWEEMGE